MVARWVHAHSAFCAGPFVKVNCAAIPGSLLESELFGYEKGAFTGAYASKPGRVEMAHKGTLFLDEIAELDLTLQSKLLHFLQDGRFSRIGDEVERSVETRLICSSNRNLEQEIEAQRFRSDPRSTQKIPTPCHALLLMHNRIQVVFCLPLPTCQKFPLG